MTTLRDLVHTAAGRKLAASAPQELIQKNKFLLSEVTDGKNQWH